MPRTHTRSDGVLSLVLTGVFLVVLIIGTGVMFSVRGSMMMREELRTRLHTAAAVGAMQFRAEDIAGIRGRDDMNTALFRDTVATLALLRSEIPDIAYAYIMRRTDDPMTLEFVADADSLLSLEEADLNRNGVLDPDEKLSLPGDPYDIAEVPALQNDAFLRPSVDLDFNSDQWGMFLSAYAPIRTDDGATVAVLGLDMQAEEFLQRSRGMFSILFLALFCIFGLLASGSVLLLLHRRRIAVLNEMEEERSALLSLALHQLGTPLAIFRWWVEILRERYGDVICKDGDACLQLEEGIVRLERVYKSLQDAQNVSEGRIRYAAEETRLAELIGVVIEQKASESSAKHQTVIADVPADITMKLDRKLTAGVVEELLENASIYSPEHTTITVRARKNRDAVTISVKDHGYGMHADDLPRIFNRFFRGRNAIRHKVNGNGMGLFIARTIVERAGGRIWAESRLNRGTTVSFTLPLSGR